MQVDYIVVGVGLAGINFCEQLKANNKSFLVFDNNSQNSSTVAAGLYNPVVLKRFTSVWKSKEQLDMALPMYLHLQERLNIKLDYKIPVYRKFSSFEEQNDWFAASDRANLSEYLSTQTIKNKNRCIQADFGFGRVLNSGRIDVKSLVETYKKDLRKDNLLIEQSFDYNSLIDTKDVLAYGDIMAKYIVFAEGFGIKENPFFSHLPLRPTKGELLTIKAPNLKIDYVLKSGIFLIPIGNYEFLVGATYNWDDTSSKVTEQAKKDLLSKLDKLITCDYQVIDHVAGIRPTVIDRRPLVGVHPIHEKMFVLNGLGTRGVMIGPYVAKQLFNFIENNMPLEKEIDIMRFT